MSTFACDKCDKTLVDTPSGYITGCSHYKRDIDIVLVTVYHYKRRYDERHHYLSLFVEEKLVISGTQERDYARSEIEGFLRGYNYPSLELPRMVKFGFGAGLDFFVDLENHGQETTLWEYLRRLTK